MGLKVWLHKKYAERTFEDKKIWITAEGARHLDGKLIEIDFKEKYIQNVVQTWKSQLETSSKAGEIQ